MIVFHKKQNSTILGCIMLLAIILLNLTGCGGGGGNDDPVVYRLVKMESYEVGDTTAYYTVKISYDGSGNPFQMEESEIDAGTTTTLTYIMTPVFKDGKLESMKLSDSSDTSKYMTIKYEHNAAGQLEKYTSYEGTAEHGDECTLIYENGKRVKSVFRELKDEINYNDPEYAKYVYDGERIKEIDDCSDENYNDRLGYVDYEYDSNGNIKQSNDYQDNGTKNEYTVYTWEKGKSTLDWNNYNIFLP